MARTEETGSKEPVTPRGGDDNSHCYDARPRSKWGRSEWHLLTQNAKNLSEKISWCKAVAPPEPEGPRGTSKGPDSKWSRPLWHFIYGKILLMSTVIAYYNQILEMIPETYRLPIAVLILIFLIFALVNFFKKNLIWIILFIILLPAAWPSIRQIYLSVANLITQIPK